MFTKVKKIFKKPKWITKVAKFFRVPKWLKKISQKIAHNKIVRFITKPFKAFGLYLRNSWIELRQVRWPNRRATWSMTLSVIIFSAFFIVLIILLDAGFKELFKLIIK